MDSISPLSSTWVTQLVNQVMQLERRPVASMETQRDTLQVKNAIYDDVSSKIQDVQSAIEGLHSDTYGVYDAFATKSVSLVNADPDVDVAKVSVGNTAVPGVYDLNVTKLAQSHQIGSAQQAQSTTALNLSGTFTIGGAAARSVSNSDAGGSNPLNDATPFATGSIRSGETELGSNTYYVEFQQNDSGTWQFRLVDDNGDAVTIDDASDAGTAMTSNWQDFSNVKNSTFDTGRGLTIAFDDVDATQQQLIGDTNTASVDYTAQGASITVSATDSLNDIRDLINAATFADSNEVQATVVDKRLVLTGTSTGANATIQLFDSSYSGSNGDGILNSLGIDVDNAGALTDTANDQLRAAQDAAFTINNISISRSKNTGITNVIDGMTLDLSNQGAATITVSESNDTVVDNVKTLVEKVNDLLTFLKGKTESVAGDDDENGNPTYTFAPLSTDWNMRWLRQEIAGQMLSDYAGAVGGAPSYLHEIGITLGDDGLFELSDESALTQALSDDFDAVESLFDDLLGNLDTKLDKYVDGSGSVISLTQDSLESQLEGLNEQIDSYEERLKVREEALTAQYSAVQSQLYSMTYQFQSMQAFSGGSVNRLF